MIRFKGLLLAGALTAVSTIPGASAAQDANIVYRLGRDTVAIEQFSRSATRFTGEVVSRAGAAVVRVQYDLTLDKGRPTAAVVRRRQPDGTPFANQASEVRLTLRADSAIRETVWPDSTPRRAFAVSNAFPALPVGAYAPLELLAAMGPGKRDSVPAVGIGGNQIGFVGLQAVGGDTMRMRGGAYGMLLVFDKSGRLQSCDGIFTTNKAIGTRSAGKVDIAAIATNMKPTGTLSPRMTAYAGFSLGPIFVNYGSPAVRGRTVWGGTLVPFDTIWRTGANEATHLATSKTIQIGDMTLQPGLYSLWTQHTQSGTFLIVNRQVGQWGTQYNPANDIGRVTMDMANTPENVEDFTITVRSLGQNRGAIDFAWGDKMATANFTVRPQAP